MNREMLGCVTIAGIVIVGVVLFVAILSAILPNGHTSENDAPVESDSQGDALAGFICVLFCGVFISLVFGYLVTRDKPSRPFLSKSNHSDAKRAYRATATIDYTWTRNLPTILDVLDKRGLFQFTVRLPLILMLCISVGFALYYYDVLSFVGSSIVCLIPIVVTLIIVWCMKIQSSIFRSRPFLRDTQSDKDAADILSRVHNTKHK